ncbi:hypothetical protein DFA_00803 [Cavenderia fasciculata]|uniref:Uncharacterized protein n=1 Tax=Cavenderia fasciculata TaxID=261658 RepID=F4PTV6_CACFS|nr:uncharacterized protein DFA_00803 [Cavenderia fasciculata]EGG20935.1 hypothetical protein DFA_00803 [Cavenderia fasciculata]|eukprot:XP_004358785.1 hypothetical protein DFA_00803 [Cavenderia fasciculata]
MGLKIGANSHIRKLDRDIAHSLDPNYPPHVHLRIEKDEGQAKLSTDIMIKPFIEPNLDVFFCKLFKKYYGQNDHTMSASHIQPYDPFNFHEYLALQPHYSGQNYDIKIFINVNDNS